MKQKLVLKLENTSLLTSKTEWKIYFTKKLMSLKCLIDHSIWSRQNIHNDVNVKNVHFSRPIDGTLDQDFGKSEINSSSKVVLAFEISLTWFSDIVHMENGSVKIDETFRVVRVWDHNRNPSRDSENFSIA